MRQPQFVSALKVNNSLGEGVIWDARTQAAWWTDIRQRRLYRYTPALEQLAQWDTPRRLACFARVAERDYLIAGFENGFAWYEPDTGYLEWLQTTDSDQPRVRLNDGRADRQGRFWAGSMVEGGEPGDNSGRLYRLDRDLELTPVLGDLRISNGLCWSPDGTTMYHTDTPSRRIYRYDFDTRTGAVSNRRLFAATDAGCFPDGSTVDAEGCVWNAQWGGSQVVRYTADGEVDLILPVPVSQPTCVALGGPDLDLLFVTSARDGLSAADLASQADAGSVLLYHTETRGLPDPEFMPTSAA